MKTRKRNIFTPRLTRCPLLLRRSPSTPISTLPRTYNLHQTSNHRETLWRVAGVDGEERVHSKCGGWTGVIGQLTKTSVTTGFWRFITSTLWTGTCVAWTRFSSLWSCSWARGRPSSVAVITKKWRRSITISSPSLLTSERYTTPPHKSNPCSMTWTRQMCSPTMDLPRFNISNSLKQPHPCLLIPYVTEKKARCCERNVSKELRSRGKKQDNNCLW